MKAVRLATIATALLAFSPFATAADGPAAGAAAAEKAPLDITVSILPHTFLVKAIGGDEVKVNTLVGAGQDPHQFNITPAQTVALSASDAFFTSGMPFEAQFILKIREGAPDLKIVQINKGIALIESDHDHHHHAHADDEEHPADEGDATSDAHAEDDHDDHGDHEDHHDHDHCGPDVHTWTSPALLAFQAVTVFDTLAELAPDRADTFAKNRDELLSKIFDVDTEIAKRLKPFKGKTFFVFHPAFQYFGNQYGLIEESIEVGGKQPTPKQLLAIIEEAGAAEANSLFIQPQFDTAVTGEIARQIDAELVTVDPLTEDILPTLIEFSKALAESYSAP